LKIFLAGRVAAESGDGPLSEARFPGRQGRLLFACLVVARGKQMTRGELAEALWQDDPPASWESALRLLVSKLRKVFADSPDGERTALLATDGGYRLELPPGTWVDVFAADSAARDAEGRLGAGAADEAIAPAMLSESLLREPFMAGEDGDWVQARRREYEGVRAGALNTLADASLQSGRAETSVHWAEQAVELEPFRDSGYRRLMAAHAAAGNRAEALQVYDRCRRLLAEELGAYPSPQTEAAYRRLLEEPEPAGADGVPPVEAAAAATMPPRSTERRRGRRIGLTGLAFALAGAVAAILVSVDQGGMAAAIRPNSIVRVDPTTLKVSEVASVGDDPDLVVAAGGYLWVTNHILRGGGTSGSPRNAGDQTLTRVDPLTGKTRSVGGLAPCGITPDPSGDVWIANCYPTSIPSLHDDVVRVDARTLRFKTTLSAPGGDGFYRGLAYGDGSLWVTQIVGGAIDNTNTLTEINPETGRERSIPLALSAHGLAWSDGYGQLWITNFEDAKLTRLSPTTKTKHTINQVAAAPAFPVVDGNVIWVADWAGAQVVRIDAVGPPRTHRIPLRGGTGVWNIAVGAGAVWATTPSAGALWRINPTTNKATRIPLPYAPTGVAADANDVWVTLRQH
jgi:DNA-binding SARP family transcriptional activator/streptogramin lyase